MFVITKENRAKPLIKMAVMPEFINVIMENNWLHKSGTNGMFYNLAMKGFHYCHTFLF